MNPNTSDYLRLANVWLALQNLVFIAGIIFLWHITLPKAMQDFMLNVYIGTLFVGSIMISIWIADSS